MKLRILLTAILAVTFSLSQGQTKRDTIIVELARTSKVMLTIGDRSDLQTLKHYDFQELFQDILTKLEQNDTTRLAGNDSTSSDVAAIEPEDKPEDWNVTKGDAADDDNNDESHDDWNVHVRHNRWGRTWQSFNVDFGTNNYLSDGKFPNDNDELYSVRPWGSWYVGLASIQRTRLGKKFFLEWGLGVNWYNFKFEQHNILMQKNDDGVSFVEDPRDLNYVKSKLTASYLTASIIPVIDFGDNSRKVRIWEGYGSSFRVGLGPYLGYRIESHSKLVYKDDGKEKEKEHDSFYLNNLRYGLRLQLGYRATDFFFNYDLNELFAEGKGPKLNAFSFGVIF